MMLVRVGEYSYEVFGLICLTLFGPWRWQARDLGAPNGAGVVFGCYPQDDPHEVAHIVVADGTDDPDEPDVSVLTPAEAQAFDRVLEGATREQMAAEGRRLVRWMGSHLNDTPKFKGLVTAYIAADQGRERQHLDARLSIKGSKLFLSGCFDVARAGELAGPIMDALRQIAVLNRPVH